MVSTQYSTFLVVLLCIGSVRTDYSKSTDYGFEFCPKSSPNFDSCLTTAIEKATQLLISGSSVYHIPPIDPLKQKSLTVGSGTGAVHLTQEYKNLVITGLSDMKINQTHMDWTTNTLTVTTLHKKIEQTADYNINGKILLLPVQGDGDCRLALEDISVGHTLKFEETKKDQKTYFSVISYTLNMIPSHVSYHFNNLFNGNQLLGDNINRLLNEEWRAVYYDVRDGYEKSYAAIFQKFAQYVFKRIPLKEMFPE